MLTSPLRGTQAGYSAHFTGVETEAYRDYLPCLQPHELMEPGGKSGSSLPPARGFLCFVFLNRTVKCILSLSLFFLFLPLCLWCFWEDVWPDPNCCEEWERQKLHQLSGFGELTKEFPLLSRGY